VTVRAEETADDDETWGKTTTRLHGLPRRKESRNGVVERRLAGGEWVAMTYLSVGEKAAKGGGSFGRRLPL
jgi:hypothetical protein